MEQARELTLYFQIAPDSRLRVKMLPLGGTGVKVPGRHDLDSSLLRLRSWTSSGSTCYSSSSQPERVPSPSLLNTTGPDTMPKFAFSSEDEGASPAPVGPKRPIFILGEPDLPPAATPVMPKPSSLSGKRCRGWEGWYDGTFLREKIILR